MGRKPLLLLPLVLLLSLQGCAGNESDTPTSPVTTIAADRPAEVDLDVSAKPGGQLAELAVRVHFNIEVMNARVVMDEVVPVTYEETERITIFEQRRRNVAQALQRGEVLWQGNAEAGQGMEFSRHVLIASDTLHVARVFVTGDLEAGASAMDDIDRGVGFVYFALKPDTVISHEVGYRARKVEIAHELRQQGFGEYVNAFLYGDTQEHSEAWNSLRQRDLKMAWLFENPFETPREGIDTVTAPDGTRLPVKVLPEFMLAQLPDSLRGEYNNHSAVVDQYHERLRLEQRAQLDASRVTVDFPPGLSYDDLPDSLMAPYNPALSAAERKVLHQQRLRAIRDWIEDQKLQ